MLKIIKWLLRQLGIRYRVSAKAEWEEYIKPGASAAYLKQAEKWTAKADAVHKALKELERI